MKILKFKEIENKYQKKFGNAIEKLTLAFLIVVIFVAAFNFYQVKSHNNLITGNAVIYNLDKFSDLDVIPKGIPEVYGKELGVSFDDVSAINPQKADTTIGNLGVLDEKIVLSGNDFNRYVSIVNKISCEYCCGTPSIIFSDGKPACGCAHSYAMRGLAKYLIKYHGSEYTDDQILEELGKWKTLFFPEKITEKAIILNSKGIELNYINLASNKYRDIEKGSAVVQSSGMVGGC